MGDYGPTGAVDLLLDDMYELKENVKELKEAIKILRIALDMQDPYVLSMGDLASNLDREAAQMMLDKSLEALALTEGLDE